MLLGNKKLTGRRLQTADITSKMKAINITRLSAIVDKPEAIQLATLAAGDILVQVQDAPRADVVSCGH